MAWMHERGTLVAACTLLAMTTACGDKPGEDNPFMTASGLTNVSGTGDTGDDDDDSATGMQTKLDMNVGGIDDSTGNDTNEECASVDEMSTIGLQPADIIVVVDNSGSMNAEAGFVQQHINAFSSQIFLANVDAHVVLISASPTQSDNGICVNPPLGAGGCPGGDDTKEPTYLHIADGVGSNNAWDKILQHAPTFMADPWWRPTARKHILVVTDDDSDMSAQQFDQAFRALDPSHETYVYHAIASPEDPVLACLSQTVCCPFGPLSAALSAEHIQLVQMRGGIFGNLCTQDFLPVFNELSTEVVSGASLACEYDIPPPPDGEAFDPDKVNVQFDSGVGTLEIGRVDDPADCPNVADGWYYDNPAAPTKIVVCPQTCTKIQGFQGAAISIQFGCATVDAPPVG